MTSLARAEPLPVPTRAELKVPRGCPSADQFLSDINARIPVRAASADEPALTLLVEVELSGGKYIGRMGSSSTAGVESRRIEGASCSEVMAALALSAALALEDGQWELVSPPQVAPASAATEPLATPPASALAPALVVEHSPAPETPRHRAMTVGMGLQASAVTLPFMWGPALSVGFRASPHRFLVQARLAYLIELPDTETSAELSMPMAGLDLCPYGLTLAPSLSLWPCGSFEAGALRGRGQRLEAPKSATLLYGAIGAGLVLEWTLLRFRFAWSANASATWARPRFTSESPARTLTEAGGWALGSGVFVSYSF